MRNILLLVFTIVFIAGCQSVIPVVDKNYVPDIQIQELAAKMVNAVDPNGIYRQSKSYYMRQELMINDKSVTYEVLYKSPNKFRTVMSLDNRVLQKIVCNGVKCWSTSDKGERTEITGLEFDRLKLLDELSSSKGTILDVFEKVEFAGEDKVGDSQCYVLICYPKTKELEPMARYVSKSDYLVRKLVTVKAGAPYIADIKKYALLKGVMIPSETEMDINNDGTKELMRVTDYMLNLEVSDKEFDK
ncbi:MAG TPA: hypothetical protein DET40_25585 [Lentisphaeria bacterium]|nr:MAG: hypothetical protein A2X45_04730 [Lentisphaerae bacterium GWF2_50_93]HCE46933.1 hypothetical protein [Lentisphaeria bacterium]